MTLTAHLAWAAWLAALVLSGTSLAAESSGTHYFITFGDSYSQTGFDVKGAAPTAANPLGNPAFPGYTTAGGTGINWLGRALTEHNATTLLSYNFAAGGATTSAALVAPYEPSVRSLVDQVAQFAGSIAARPASAPWTSATALFGLWIGVNDVGYSHYKSNATDIADAIMLVILDQLQVLYDAGARNYVLLGVPPIHKTPAMLAQGAEAAASEAAFIKQYNDRLASSLDSFASKNTGVSAKFVDTTAAFDTALNDPVAYGAANASCFSADGTSCLWFNDYHPALAIHKLVAEAVAAAWKGIFFQ